MPDMTWSIILSEAFAGPGVFLSKFCEVLFRGVHGNGKDWDPMGPMGFPWEWE